MSYNPQSIHFRPREYKTPYLPEGEYWNYVWLHRNMWRTNEKYRRTLGYLLTDAKDKGCLLTWRESDYYQLVMEYWLEGEKPWVRSIPGE